MAEIDDDAEGGEASSPDVQGNGVSSLDLPAIAELRQTDKRAYFKPEIQARELALLGEQPPAVEDSPPKPWWESQPQDAPQDAGEENELIAVEDLPVDLQPAGEFATGVLAEDAMSSETFEAFTSELSETAQDALIEEMSQSPDGDAEPATDAQLETFEATREGETMVLEWGHEAAEKLGIVSQRYNRLRNNLPSHERETFDDLFDELPPAAIEQAYRELAG